MDTVGAVYTNARERHMSATVNRIVHRILVRGAHAPLPPEAKKILKI